MTLNYHKYKRNARLGGKHSKRLKSCSCFSLCVCVCVWARGRCLIPSHKGTRDQNQLIKCSQCTLIIDGFTLKALNYSSLWRRRKLNYRYYISMRFFKTHTSTISQSFKKPQQKTVQKECNSHPFCINNGSFYTQCLDLEINTDVLNKEKY